MKNKSKGFAVNCKGVVYHPPSQPDLTILDGIDLQVASGEFVAIVGANGSGKSSLLAAIAGEIVLPRGTITVGSRLINNEPIHKRIDGVGIVHQHDDEDLLHAFSIAMNVAFRQANNGCHPNRFWACNQQYCSKLAKRLAETAPQLGADLDKLVGHLNGGGRQMLNLVIAIHLEHENNPCRLILLDEHTSKLDHKNSSKVMEFTQSQISQAEATAIMVTHRYHDAIKYCDRIIVMDGGKIVTTFSDPRNTSLGDIERAVENVSA
ncbi:MAG: ATP-binding cassette domain-containing protein [Verrucomicrobiota bacterium]